MTISAPETEPGTAMQLTFGRDRFTVRFSDGTTLTVPIGWYPRLQHASTRERSQWRLVGDGAGLHWPDLVQDISLQSLLAGRRSMESEKSFAKWLAARTKKASKSA